MNLHMCELMGYDKPIIPYKRPARRFNTLLTIRGQWYVS